MEVFLYLRKDIIEFLDNYIKNNVSRIVKQNRIFLIKEFYNLK